MSHITIFSSQLLTMRQQANTSTALHLEHSDVVNLMFHGKLTWHIFPARDAKYVEKYLKHLNSSNDDIESFTELFSGRHFLTEDDLNQIHSQYKVEPVTVTETSGMAIIIPAGCPYQVYFLICCEYCLFMFIS